MKVSSSILCINSKIINNTNFYGKFQIGLFPLGQSLTVANTLRRSLFTEIPGIAITFVQIIGVTTEFETLPGMRECILDVLLNLKQIIFKANFYNFSPQVVDLNVIGPGIVRAKDLHLPFFIHCINPDQPIATLTKDGHLKLKILITVGKRPLNHSVENNYNSTELLKKFNINTPSVSNNPKENETCNLLQKRGIFPIDANFSPIIRTNYTIECHSFDRYPNQNYSTESYLGSEIIFLEIWTNGAIDPRLAIYKTFKSIINMFLPLINHPKLLNSKFLNSSPGSQLNKKKIPTLLTENARIQKQKLASFIQKQSTLQTEKNKKNHTDKQIFISLPQHLISSEEKKNFTKKKTFTVEESHVTNSKISTKKLNSSKLLTFFYNKKKK